MSKSSGLAYTMAETASVFGGLVSYRTDDPVPVAAPMPASCLYCRALTDLSRPRCRECGAPVTSQEQT